MDNQNFTEDPSAQTTTGKIISTGYKVEGWEYRARLVKNVIFGLAMIVVAGYLAYIGNLVAAGIVFLVALLAFLGSWFYWWRSKSLVKGQFYVPPQNNGGSPL